MSGWRRRGDAWRSLEKALEEALHVPTTPEVAIEAATPGEVAGELAGEEGEEVAAASRSSSKLQGAFFHPQSDGEGG